MDGGMYAHPATQANLKILRERGVMVIEPDEGRFASGLIGLGRLPETARLMGDIRRVLGHNGVLVGRKIVVTAGGTREALDPVRYISNRSSGKQGYAVAQAALDAGAAVSLISTVRELEVPVGAALVPVHSAQEMLEAVKRHADGADALVMAAAVADFRPAIVAAQKIKKSDDPQQGLQVELQRAPDILMEIKAQRDQTGWPRVVIGFAAESQDLLSSAQAKLARKGLDLIVANDISAADAGFEVDTNRAVLLDRQGRQQPLELMSKAKIGEAVIRRVADLLKQS
jgi:phosphopantothenoylcysteine decarboxylase/phosphopantothenate--cysteine ligase